MQEQHPLQGQTQGAMPKRKETGQMLESVIVDAGSTFQLLTFMGAAKKSEFIEGGQNIPADQRKQQINKEGMPVWSLTLAAMPWRGQGKMLKVNVPSYQDPAESLMIGQPVRLTGSIEYGVTTKREGGYVLWMRADGIEAAEIAARKPAAAAAS